MVTDFIIDFESLDVCESAILIEEIGRAHV